MAFDSLLQSGFSPDSPLFWLALAVILGAVSALAWGAQASGRARGLRAELDRARRDLAAADVRAEEAGRLREDLERERTERSRLESEVAAGAVRLAEREASLADLKQRMDVDFKAAASKMLEEAHSSFLQRANETFEKHRESAGAEAERRRKALDELIKPMSETLDRYEKGLVELRADQQKQRGELLGRMGDLARAASDVGREAQKLSTALRSGAKVRGRWGEEQLRNVVEIAGMSAYVDFVEQASHDGADGRKQPDMVVNLPGARKIAVDSKVSINAFLDAAECESDAERTAHIARHADDLWAHVKTLSAKDYAAGIRDSLDIVIMFVPGENYFAAAMEARPQLFQDAFERKVLIATPTTLVAMLKAASFNWRQAKSAENADAVARLAKDLYDSLRVMGGHFAALGKSLEGAVGKYNAAIGSLEQRVMPRARRFAEYEMPGVEAPIGELAPVEGAPRLLRDQRAHGDDDESRDEEDDRAA